MSASWSIGRLWVRAGESGPLPIIDREDGPSGRTVCLKRRAQMEHARQIERAAMWERQAQVRPAPATLARLAERMRERAFERVMGPPLHQLATRVADTTAAMRDAYGRLLDATRLREGPKVAAAHIQAVAGRARLDVKAAPERSQSARRGPTLSL